MTWLRQQLYSSPVPRKTLCRRGAKGESTGQNPEGRYSEDCSTKPKRPDFSYFGGRPATVLSDFFRKDQRRSRSHFKDQAFSPTSTSRKHSTNSIRQAIQKHSYLTRIALNRFPGSCLRPDVSTFMKCTVVARASIELPTIPK